MYARTCKVIVPVQYSVQKKKRRKLLLKNVKLRWDETKTYTLHKNALCWWKITEHWRIKKVHCGYMVWQHYAVVLVVPSSTQRWLAFLLRRRTMLESISAAVLLSFASSFSLLLASFRRVRLRHVSSSDSFKMPLACKHGEGKAGEWMLSKHLTTAIISMNCIH